MVGSAGMLAIAPRPAAIAGGFVLISVASLEVTWRRCRRRPLGLGDFRAWLACHELVARRGRIEGDRAPVYDHSELAKVLGVSPRRAKASVRRLVGSALLLWSDSAIGFPEPDPAPAEPAVGAFADSIGSAKGDLAIPRRLLRFLVEGARPALLATALGALFRCLSRRKGGFDGWGRLKASWVARAFGVGLRAVKAARLELVEIGWLAPEASSQVAMNRHGRAYRIDLAWLRPGLGDGRGSTPPPAASGRGSTPPLLDQDPLSGGGKNQDPAAGGPAGIFDGSMDACDAPVPVEPSSPPAPPAAPMPSAVPAAIPSPRLDDVRPEDLVEVARLIELHRQAAARGLVGSSEADRLKFAAAAEHARAVGRRNPCGLFARIVARGWWHYSSLGEEERAARWLREGARRSASEGAHRSPVSVMVDRGPMAVGSVLGRLGIGGEPPGRRASEPVRGSGSGGPVRRTQVARGPSMGSGADPGRTPGGRAAARGGRPGGPEETAMLARLARLMGK